MKVLFIDTENEIKDIDNFKDFDIVYLLNPSDNWKDTDRVKTTPACYNICENKDKFGQIRFEVGINNEYKVLTTRPESFLTILDCTFGNMIKKEI